MAKRTIFDDPRYPAFVERYHADPLRFAVEVCGQIPSEDQEDLFNAMVDPQAKVSVVSGTGCFAAGTKMMRSTGEAVLVEDIRVGDRLMGPDGASVRNVLELKRGREPMYRFTYADGTEHVFNESHLLCLEATGTYAKGDPAKDRFKVTVKEWLEWPAQKKRRHYVYRSPVIAFDRQQPELPMPPYLLGVWLGDGMAHKPSITSADPEVIAEWKSYIESIGCDVSEKIESVSKSGSACYQVAAARVKGTPQENPVTGILRSLNVLNSKHIPDCYRYASFNDRLELLAGLIDTDGYFDKRSCGYEIAQKIEDLAAGIAWLARSIGCHSTISKVSKSCQSATGDYWLVRISRGVDVIPCRVPRRKPPVETKAKALRHGIKHVECLGEGDYYGFVLDADGRFLMNDFTVASNTGKSYSFARIALWHLLCHPYGEEGGDIQIGSNTYIGAPRVAQVGQGIWKEINDARGAIYNSPCAWINDYYTVNKTTVTMNGFDSQWFITQMALQAGQSVGVAGKHRVWQLVIVDEAAGVADSHFDVIDGTQTQIGNRTLMASQGVRNTGRFYDSHHRLSTKNGGSWVSLCFSSERSPFVTTKWLKDRETECGGRNTVEYKIRVLGQFAEDSGNILLTRNEIESAFIPRQIIQDDEPFGLVVLGDVGLGEYRDDSVATIAKIIGNDDHGIDARRVEFIEVPICTNDKNEIDFAGDLANLVGRLSNATLYVDNGGVGHTVATLIERSGVPVNRIDWGKPCFKKEYKERFYNQRACANVRLRDAIRTGRVVLPQGLDQYVKQKIIDQGSRLPYHFAEAGGLRYVMDKKEDMAKEGIKSPDIWDTFAFAFLEGTTYVPAESYTPTGAVGRKEAATSAAADAFADIA